MKEIMGNPLGLQSCNHISLVCRSVEKSLDFYENVLGLYLVKRPASFGFDGAWLYNYGTGIHLIKSDDPDKLPKITEINPKHNHISFQSESITTTEKKLEEMKIEYVKRRVKDSGTYVDQLFFHDPDGYMIEICDCDNLPVIPLAPGDIVQSNVQQHQTIQYTGQRMQQQQVTCLTSIHMKEDNLLFV